MGQMQNSITPMKIQLHCFDGVFKWSQGCGFFFPPFLMVIICIAKIVFILRKLQQCYGNVANAITVCAAKFCSFAACAENNSIKEDCFNDYKKSKGRNFYVFNQGKVSNWFQQIWTNTLQVHDCNISKGFCTSYSSQLHMYLSLYCLLPKLIIPLYYFYPGTSFSSVLLTICCNTPTDRMAPFSTYNPLKQKWSSRFTLSPSGIPRLLS